MIIQYTSFCGGGANEEGFISDGLRVLRRGPIETAPSAGTYFSGEKSDERQARPLAKAEGFQKLLFGVMEGRVYGVNGRDRQGHSGLAITERQITPKTVIVQLL